MAEIRSRAPPEETHQEAFQGHLRKSWGWHAVVSLELIRESFIGGPNAHF